MCAETERMGGQVRWKEGGGKQGRRERNDTEKGGEIEGGQKEGMTRTEGERGKQREVERDKAGREGGNLWE